MMIVYLFAMEVLLHASIYTQGIMVLSFIAFILGSPFLQRKFSLINR